jgi:hypothetical protein
MTLLEWVAQGALLALLLAVVPAAWRLERQISALRREGAALEGGADRIAEATGAAESALARLRATAELAGRSVAERVAVAEPLRDDLRFLTERAEVLADRLDGLVRATRPLAGSAPEPTPQPAARPRSEAERDLLRALRAGR